MLQINQFFALFLFLKMKLGVYLFSWADDSKKAGIIVYSFS